VQTIHLPRAPRKRPSKSSDPQLPIGSSFARCRGCGALFKSERAFDRHRIGEFGPSPDRRCAQPPRMREMGLECVSGVWRFPKRELQPDRRLCLREIDDTKSHNYVPLTMHSIGRARARA
jgi:hypothetical protein